MMDTPTISETNLKRTRIPSREIRIITQVSPDEWQVFLPSFGLCESNDKQELIDMLAKYGYGYYLREWEDTIEKYYDRRRNSVLIDGAYPH